jgi:outer membrane protein assembly factor BamB
MKRISLFIMASGIMIAYFSTVLITLGQLQDSPWPMFHHDLKLTGRSPYVGPETSTLKWAYDTGNDVKSSPVISADGTIYVLSENKLFALYPEGTIKWSYTVNGLLISQDCTPAIDATGVIYLGDNTNPYGWVYAIYSDGTLKWTTTHDDVESYTSPAVAPDGTIYIGTQPTQLEEGGDWGFLVALDPDDGSLKWSFKVANDNYFSAPAVVEDTIYVCAPTHDYALSAIVDTGDGAYIKWRYETEQNEAPVSSPAVSSEGRIYLGLQVGTGGGLYAFEDDGDSASLKWSYGIDGAVWSSPAIGADGTIYVGSDDNKLYAIEDKGDQGDTLWTYSTGDDVRSSPAVDANGTIYVGSYDDKLYAINSDGSLRWKYSTGVNICSSPAIGADGTIYIGSYDGELYAIGIPLFTQYRGCVYAPLTAARRRC